MLLSSNFSTKKRPEPIRDKTSNPVWPLYFCRFTIGWSVAGLPGGVRVLSSWLLAFQV
jgi:hypothetical protein